MHFPCQRVVIAGSTARQNHYYTKMTKDTLIFGTLMVMTTTMMMTMMMIMAHISRCVHLKMPPDGCCQHEVLLQGIVERILLHKMVATKNRGVEKGLHERTASTVLVSNPRLVYDI